MNSHVNAQGTSFVGPDAVSLYATRLLAMHLRLYARTKMIPTRGYTITRMLQQATKITHKPYTRTKVLQAAHDLDVWCEALHSALPIVNP